LQTPPGVATGAILRSLLWNGRETPSRFRVTRLCGMPSRGFARVGMSGRPKTLATLPRGSISNASKPPRWYCTHTRRTVDTSNAKNRFTDLRALCATIALSANTFSATVYAKVVSAPSKTAYLRIRPFPPIRSGSNNRELGRPRRRDGLESTRSCASCISWFFLHRVVAEGNHEIHEARERRPLARIVRRAAGSARGTSLIPTSCPLSRGTRLVATAKSGHAPRDDALRREPRKVNRENAIGRRREGEEERER
jgi:hypothetical protein